jgi:c(7)-type cytochrome triheme protein
MKYAIKYLLMIGCLLISVNILAVPPGMKIEFTKSPMGKVTFDGKTHAAKGLLCNACHPIIFQQKKGVAKMKLADHQKGEKFCFACHNGKNSFASAKNCNKCHIK